MLTFSGIQEKTTHANRKSSFLSTRLKEDISKLTMKNNVFA